MAHVQIHINPRATTASAAFRMVVDGTDISGSVLAEGFAIEPGDPGTGRPSVVSLQLEAEVLDLDLPGAVLDAILTKTGA